MSTLQAKRSEEALRLKPSGLPSPQSAKRVVPYLSWGFLQATWVTRLHFPTIHPRVQFAGS